MAIHSFSVAVQPRPLAQPPLFLRVVELNVIGVLCVYGLDWCFTKHGVGDWSVGDNARFLNSFPS